MGKVPSSKGTAQQILSILDWQVPYRFRQHWALVLPALFLNKGHCIPSRLVSGRCVAFVPINPRHAVLISAASYRRRWHALWGRLSELRGLCSSGYCLFRFCHSHVSYLTVLQSFLSFRVLYLVSFSRSLAPVFPSFSCSFLGAREPAL